MEVEDGEWTSVMTTEQYEKHGKNEKNEKNGENCKYNGKNGIIELEKWE